MSYYDCPNCEKELEYTTYEDSQYPYECHHCGVYHQYNAISEEYETCEAE